MILYRWFRALLVPFELLLKTTRDKASFLVNFFTITTKKPVFQGRRNGSQPSFLKKISLKMKNL